MTLLTSVVVALVVWTVSLIRAAEIRAVVYSLPVPMSVVLMSTGLKVDGSQLVGVLLLIVFFLVVSQLYARAGWPILVADAAGALVYIGFSALLRTVTPLPFLPTLALVTGVWLALILAAVRTGRRGRPSQEPARRDPVPPEPMPAEPVTVRGALGKLALVFCATLPVVSMAGLLRGLVVTFPYSGVLVAVEVRPQLTQFTRSFTVNCIALVAFFAGFYALQDTHTRVTALAGGWAAFGACLITVRLVPRWARTKFASAA